MQRRQDFAFRQTKLGRPSGPRKRTSDQNKRARRQLQGVTYSTLILSQSFATDIAASHSRIPVAKVEVRHLILLASFWLCRGTLWFRREASKLQTADASRLLRVTQMARWEQAGE